MQQRTSLEGLQFLFSLEYRDVSPSPSERFSPVSLKCFMRGDGEQRAANFCQVQRELAFYVGKELGVKSIELAGETVGHSPMTNLRTKSYSARPPEEYLHEQCAVKMLNSELKKGEPLWTPYIHLCQLVMPWNSSREKTGLGNEGFYGRRGLTRPSQLLMATVAPGTSVMSPTKVQSVFRGSRRSALSVPVRGSVWLVPAMALPPVLSLTFPRISNSSCHSTIASGATSLLFGRRRRWNSLPKAVMLKKSFCSAPPEGCSSLLARRLWVAEMRCDR